MGVTYIGGRWTQFQWWIYVDLGSHYFDNHQPSRGSFEFPQKFSDLCKFCWTPARQLSGGWKVGFCKVTKQIRRQLAPLSEYISSHFRIYFLIFQIIFLQSHKANPPAPTWKANPPTCSALRIYGMAAPHPTLLNIQPTSTLQQRDTL